ncbi:MAG: hypothetical protein SPLUMA2_SPLUMAMAG2_01682 [uncultured Sulfurimonas sp.]|nr:MAG: hypothetical protein SPLUMA2_SPLUMAMAG2_01682 [uncultured Sulfurimonas sp.]
MKTLLKLLYAPLYFLLLSTSVIAAEYTCDGEDVLNLNNATASASTSYSENTSDNDSRYFKFSTAINGEVTFTIDKHNVEQQIYIGTSCEDDDEFKGDEDKVYVSSTFSVSSSETYYIRIRERNDPEELYFDITFNFTADNAFPIVDAGSDTSTPVNTAVTLSGSASDSDGTIESFEWSKDGSVLATTASFDYTPPTGGEHTLTFKATDDSGNSAQDTLIVKAINTLRDSTATVYRNGTQDFELINSLDSQNIIGNTQIIGNTIECVTTTRTASSSDYSKLTCDDTTGDFNNNNYTVKYINIDSTKINSSTATIELPSTFKTIAWVGLFWQGSLRNDSIIYKSGGDEFKSNDLPPGGIESTSANTIEIKVGSNSVYQTIIADKLYYIKAKGFSPEVTYDPNYAAYTDITSLFTEEYTPSSDIEVTVANIQTTRGLNTSLGNYGAWTVAVVYHENENSSLSKLRNNSVYFGYKQIAYGKPDSITLDGFLLPKRGTIDSQMAVFAAEGEYIYSPDGMKLNETALGDPDTNNVFDARLSDSITRNPSMTNNNGIDIDVFDTSSIMEAHRDANPNATSYSATIDLSSSKDTYLPSMVSFTTELYKPHVCYYIGTISNSSGNIFENGAFADGASINAGEEYNVNFWISNMKKNIGDTDIEIADKVQVYLNLLNFNYTQDSTSMNNIDDINIASDRELIPITDIADLNVSGTIQKDDLGEHLGTQSVWRVGSGASISADGRLNIAEDFSDTKHITFISLQGSFTIDSNTTDIDLLDFFEFKASFQTDTITIGASNAQFIAQCQDLNSSGSVGLAPTGSFNVVQTSFNTTGIDPIDQAAVENRLPTQVSGRDFTVRILSLDNTNYTSLIPYNDDINISIIYTPAYTGDQATDSALCADASPIAGTQKTVAFGGASYKDPLITNTSKALKNASFQIAYNLANNPQYVCSRDVFAIRPDKLVLSSTTQDIELLRSGVNYKLSLVATQDTSTSPTLGYTINNAQSLFTNLDTNKTIYDPAGNDVTSTLNGTLSFSATNFNILNGTADNVIGINFDDVGIVNISLVDTVWSQVDMNNNDTVADCSTNGAYICGDINATFIPHHFALTNAHLKNFNGSTYTYISNDLNISAGFDLTLRAENAGNTATQNFTNGSWENPVDVSITLPVVAPTEDKNEITTTQNLGFISGAKTINATDSNLSANLIFNYNRSLSSAINPFTIDGSATTLNASSLYVSTSGTTATITGISTPDKNATFIYGRTNAPRQRFTGDEGTALIYYEAYCSGVTCDKTLLPDGPGSTSINDPRWFSNSSHIVTSGNVGVVTQKRASSISSATASGIAIASTVLTYDDADTKGYPYKATMENNASLWLIYNQYKPGVDTNEFEVEFTNTDAKWAGARETNTTTNINSSSKTNRRTMW